MLSSEWFPQMDLYANVTRDVASLYIDLMAIIYIDFSKTFITILSKKFKL